MYLIWVACRNSIVAQNTRARSLPHGHIDTASQSHFLRHCWMSIHFVRLRSDWEAVRAKKKAHNEQKSTMRGIKARRDLWLTERKPEARLTATRGIRRTLVSFSSTPADWWRSRNVSSFTVCQEVNSGWGCESSESWKSRIQSRVIDIA